MKYFRLALLIGLILFLPSHVRASDASVYDAFVNSAMSGSRSGVFFVDARTGLSTIAITNGYNHTVLGSGVIYIDRITAQVGYAKPDGSVDVHPFVQANDYLTWVVSPNHQWIVWRSGRIQAGALIQDLFIAKADGTSRRNALHISSTKNLGARPMAVTNDGSAIFYARQVEDPKAYLAFPGYEDVYKLVVDTGTSTRLPGEPRCACAGAITPDGKIIFRVDGSGSAYTGHFIEVSTRVADNVTQPLTNAFKQTGEAILNERGTQAAYLLAKGSNTKVAPEQYSLVLADVASQTQRVLLDPTTAHLRPVTFTGESLLLAGIDKDGTWKLPLNGGSLVQTSAYTYIGSLSD